MAKKKRTHAQPDKMDASPKSPRLHTALSVIMLVVAAAVIRDIYLVQYRSALPYYGIPVLDSEYYDLWAQRVAAGKGYGPMPFYMAPLYPYFLALVYKAAGHSFPIAYSVQEALGLLNLLLVYFLGRRTFGHVPALIAMGLLILYGPVMYLESKLLSETLGVTLTLVSLLLMIRAIERPSAVGSLVTGISLGPAALCRPGVLVFIVVVFAWLVLRRKVLSAGGFRIAHAAVLAVGIAMVILPVTARNYAVGRGFALISTNEGIVFAQANNPNSIGIEMPLPGFTTAIASQQQEEMRIAARRVGHPVTAFESSSYWLGQGLRFIRENPGRFAVLLGKKLIWSLHSREPGSSYNITFERRFVPILRFLVMPFAVFAGFGLYGFVRARRNGLATELLALQVCSVFVGLLIFSVSSRYRAPAIPALAVLAGFGITRLVEDVWHREFARTAVAAAWIVPMFLISLVPYPIPPVMASEPGNLGVAYMAAGDMENAVKYLDEALEMSPNSSLAHLNMGLALSRLGKPNDAMRHYRAGLKVSPDDERLRFELGNCLLVTGRAREAVPEYRKALETNPVSPETHVALGAAYLSLNMNDQAMREFRETIRLKSDLAVAHFDLSWMLYSQGKYADAWKEMHLAVRYGWKPDQQFLRDLQSKMPDPGG